MRDGVARGSVCAVIEHDPDALSPRAAWLLSLLAPGLAHAGLGLRTAVALWFGFPLALLLLFALGSLGVLGPTGWMLGSLGCLLFWWGLVPWDAARRARGRLERPETGWIVGGVTATAVLGLACLLGLRFFVLEPFRAPTASMVPTLLVGDLFLAAKGPLMRPVQRGDLVLFRREGAVFVKRVAAVGGDRIGIDRNVITLNGEVREQQPQGGFDWQDSRCSSKRSRVLMEAGESILLDDAPPGRFGDLAEAEIPEGFYFVLGDNRDHSADSRLFGLVGDEDVVGLAWWRLGSYDGCARAWRSGRSGRF